MILEKLHSPVSERVTLKFGTCSLLCRDEAERREFGSKVLVSEAMQVLFAARGSQYAKNPISPLCAGCWFM